MILLFSIILALFVAYRISQYLSAKKEKAPVQFISSFGVSHASKIPPNKIIQPHIQAGQLELIVEEENKSLVPWFESMKIKEFELLGAQLHAQTEKVMSNRTVQISA